MATPYGRRHEPDRRTARIPRLWWAMAWRGIGAFVLGAPPKTRVRGKRG